MAASRVSFWIVVMTIVLATSLFGAEKRQATGPEPKTKRSAITAAFFADPTIRLFDLQISPAELSQLTRNSETYVPAELREGETVLARVGVRLKGNGSFRSISEKPSFAIKFDEYVESQTYQGFKKLMFNNSVQDPSYLSELIATELFREAGVPAARVTHARMRLNGRDLGLYVVIEAMNKDFLKRQFGSGEGNLYEAYLQDIYGSLELDNGRRSIQVRSTRALRCLCDQRSDEEMGATERDSRCRALCLIHRHGDIDLPLGWICQSHE